MKKNILSISKSAKIRHLSFLLDNMYLSLVYAKGYESDTILRNDFVKSSFEYRTAYIYYCEKYGIIPTFTKTEFTNFQNWYK